MTAAENTRPRKPRETPWDWLFVFIIGGAFKFLGWMVTTVCVAVIVEFIGSYWWGHDHSARVLQDELSYLGTFQQNLVTGVYPVDIAERFVTYAKAAIDFLHLSDLSRSLKDTTDGILVYLSYGLETLINSIFIFAVRLSVCASALTGFVMVALVSGVDGLVERDIRRACGGIESAIAYHRAKRLIRPLIFVSFGVYMGSPVSIHPTIIFLPIMFSVGVAIYITTSRFKKFL